MGVQASSMTDGGEQASAAHRSWWVEDVEQMLALGRALGQAVTLGWSGPGPRVVALSGPLGAGKTSLARGIGEGLGLATEVQSPTFVILAEHEGQPPLLHADLYRVGEGDLRNLGLDELIEQWPGLVLVEWAELHPDLLPADRIDLQIRIEGEGRRVEARAMGPRSQALLCAWGVAG